jgi:serine/threonine protein kinase
VNHIETLTHHRSFRHYYTVLNQIDNGVFNGFSKSNRKHCAIKEVIKDYTSHEDLRLAYSERDITQLLKIYNHNGINQIYDIIETADKIYIVEEQIEKGNLNNVLSCYSHLICFKSIYNMIMQLINTIHFIHSLGIVHRDLKMENVLVKFTHKGVEAKVIDFGISKIITKNETLTAKYGTFNNLPPEIIKGETYFHNIDIWNLGIVIYNLLYKQHPFPLKKIMELNKAITKGDVVYPVNIAWSVNDGNNQQERNKADVVVEVMKKCLIKNQYLRPDANELMEYVEGN